jgi:hypothetical protein
MFNPLPPASDQPAVKPQDLDHEPVVTFTSWRPRGRWPALLRLSWLFRVFAVLSLLIGIGWALVSMAVAIGGQGPSGVAAFVTAVVAVLSGIAGFIIYLGLAELVLLAVAVERNTRQTRDRLPKPHADDF